jgi:hypothetical protein
MTLVFINENCHRPCSSRPRRDAVATRREAFLPPSSQSRNQAKPFCRILSAIFFHEATQSNSAVEFLPNISTHPARNNRSNSFKTNNRRHNTSTQNADSPKYDFEPKSCSDSAFASVYASKKCTRKCARRICEHSIHPALSREQFAI